MLFVGGAADGRNIDVPINKDRWEIANLWKTPIKAYCRGVAVPITAPAGTIEVYTRRKFDGFDLMALSTMTYPQIVRAILNNYRPEVNHE